MNNQEFKGLLDDAIDRAHDLHCLAEQGKLNYVTSETLNRIIIELKELRREVISDKLKPKYRRQTEMRAIIQGIGMDKSVPWPWSEQLTKQLHRIDNVYRTQLPSGSIFDKMLTSFKNFMCDIWRRQ